MALKIRLRRMGRKKAPHYRIEEPHRLVSTSGVRFWEMPDDDA